MKFFSSVAGRADFRRTPRRHASRQRADLRSPTGPRAVEILPLHYGVREQRNPMSKPRSVGVPLPRAGESKFDAVSTKSPPRTTRPDAAVRLAQSVHGSTYVASQSMFHSHISPARSSWPHGPAPDAADPTGAIFPTPVQLPVPLG